MFMKEVIIKCFKTLKNYYFYDRNSNSLIKVSQKEYETLKKIEEKGVIPTDSSCLKKYINSGLLQKKKTIEIKHPSYDDIEYHASNKVKQLILQVTQQCNLRCSYCAYSGNYYNREHSNKRMSFDLAKKAIDFYYDHANETDKLIIAFYGGEPLLEFQLIKKCVEYAETRTRDKELVFYITTNGTLLTDEIITFLTNHKFALTISLDGNKEEHDINRRFRNGEGSFDLIIRNLQRIKDFDNEYFSTIRYNTVINPKADLEKVLEYFMNSKLINPRQVILSMLTVTGVMNNSLLKTDESFWIPHRYETLKVFLYMIEKISCNDLNPLYMSIKNSIELFYKELRQHSEEAAIMHHGGPCIAGTRRLFVNTTGNLYPCERVSESIDEMEIGSIEQGFNCEKMRSILNIGKLTKEQCLECWNLRLCRICAGEIEPIDNKLTTEGKLLSCNKSINEILYGLRELCVLIENGYRYREEECYE